MLWPEPSVIGGRSHRALSQMRAKFVEMIELQLQVSGGFGRRQPIRRERLEDELSERTSGAGHGLFGRRRKSASARRQRGDVRIPFLTPGLVRVPRHEAGLSESRGRRERSHAKALRDAANARKVPRSKDRK